MAHPSLISDAAAACAGPEPLKCIPVLKEMLRLPPTEFGRESHTTALGEIASAALSLLLAGAELADDDRGACDELFLIVHIGNRNCCP